MTTAHPTALSWSSGKDAAWSLHVLNKSELYDVRILVTTFNESFGRAAMHGTRRALVRAQARAAALPLLEIPLPWPCSNAVYESRMTEAIKALTSDHGVTHFAFGDLYLEDVRNYRIRALDQTTLEPVFPLWGMPTRELAETMLAAGVEAYLSCIDPRILPQDFAGRRWDQALLDALPSGSDPCGENGEFHTVVVDGPAMAWRIEVERGETVTRDGFVFTDFTPTSDVAADIT